MAASGTTQRPPIEVPTPGGGLTAEAAEEARRICERLQAEMAALIRTFPVSARTIAGMSQWLGVTRPVCQRLVRATRRRGGSLTALTFFPGVRGLHQVVDAAREQGAPQAQVESARAAVERYAALIDEHGGSQKRLIAAVEATDRAPARPQDSPTAARELAFRGVGAVTRRSFGAQFLLQIYRPQEADATRMDALSVMGMLGVRRQAGSLPICPMSRYAFGDARALEAGAAVVPIDAGPVPGDGPVTLLAPFCSRPLPRVVARRSNGSILVLVDPEGDSRAPFDVVLGMKVAGVANPASAATDSRFQICSLVSDGPSHDLVMVTLLHRSLARASIPTASAIAVGRRGPVDLTPGNLPEERWFDRLPDRPTVEVMGYGEAALGAAGLAACPRLGELAEHLLASQGWGAEEFVGFRLHEAYPVWGAEYLISFDFEPVDDAAA